MDKMIKVTYHGNETIEFKSGTTYKEISEHFQNRYNYDILLAKVDNDIVDLSETLKKRCSIDFFDRSSTVGNNVYLNSAKFILILAVKNIFGKDATLVTQNSMDNGIYCTINGQKVDKKIVRLLNEEMKKISDEDYVFVKSSVSRIDAIKYFKKLNQLDKVNVLKYISNTYINLYRINDLYDYFYGKMAYSTKSINEFSLTPVDDEGFILSIPSASSPEKTEIYNHHEKLFKKFKEYSSFASVFGIEKASDLNQVVSKAKVGELINLAEAYYDSQLVKISDEIFNSKNDIKIVLIAGPSSSGKTTTSKKLNIYLRSKGFITHPISIDDYFKDVSDRPLDSEGNPDFESINAIDVKLFNDNLTHLLNGEKVNLPVYNFILGKREYNNNYLKLGEKDIIIIEGLHALNNELTKSVSDDKKYKVYIGPLTQLNVDNHNHIHTSDIRKLRRIVRDSKTRGHSALDTLKMWPSVSAGERENIFKFQDEADFVVNSALIYEIGVLKTYVEPLLFDVSEDTPEYMEALRLINFLRNFLPIPSDDVPANSVLREFIGGSCFLK